LTKALKISIVAGLSGIPRRLDLANTAQAKKRARQAEAHRARNAGQRTELRTQIKKVRTAIAGKDKPAAQLAYREATSAIDRLVGKGLVHKNAAARYKSGLNQQLRTLT
jgi:small subunit ribosomal protein S20